MAMSTSGVDWREASFPVMQEADLARWLVAGGAVVVERHGRRWQRVVPGFYQPLHFLARLRADEVHCPNLFCWGYRSALAEADQRQANATLPIYVLPDLAHYDSRRLDGRRRNAINKAARVVDTVMLDRPDVLLEQGLPIMHQAAARNPHNHGVDDRHFAAWVKAGFRQPGPVFLAMLMGSTLVGFAVAFAIEGVAYYHQHFIADAARSLNLDRFSFHATALMAQRTPGIHTLANGLHVPESEGLADFKASQGLVIAEYPSRAVIQPLLGRLLRHYRPCQYYRLTGYRRPTEAGGFHRHGDHHEESLS
jgi:hypothetical protein